jgi:50S ribosomal subunit-associated GTPase HflX
MLDASAGRDEHQLSLDGLRDLLSAYGISLEDIPLVIQLNKVDVALSSADTPELKLLTTADVPVCRTVARSGEGVLEVFSLLSGHVIERVSREVEQSATEDASVGRRTFMDGDSAGASAVTLPAVAQAAHGSVLQVNQDLRVTIGQPNAAGASEGARVCIPIELQFGEQRTSLVMRIELETQ